MESADASWPMVSTLLASAATCAAIKDRLTNGLDVYGIAQSKTYNKCCAALLAIATLLLGIGLGTGNTSALPVYLASHSTSRLQPRHFPPNTWSIRVRHASRNLMANLMTHRVGHTVLSRYTLASPDVHCRQSRPPEARRRRAQRCRPCKAAHDLAAASRWLLHATRSSFTWSPPVHRLTTSRLPVPRGAVPQV